MIGTFAAPGGLTGYAGMMKLMQQLGASATPTIFYKDAGGNLQKIQGAPSAEILTQILGPR